MYKLLRNLVLLIASLCLLNLQVFSATSNFKSLDIMEMQMYSQTFQNDTIEGRLNRIENALFAKTYNEPVSQRLNRIDSFAKNIKQNDISSNFVVPNNIKNNQENAPTKINKTTDYSSGDDSDDPPPSQGTSATDYPAITTLEQRTFHQSFVNENIYSRVLRLESKVFGTSFPNNTLADRIDKLNAALGTDNYDRNTESNSDNESNYDNFGNNRSFGNDNSNGNNTPYSDNNNNTGSENTLFDLFKGVLQNLFAPGYYPNNFYTPISGYNNNFGSSSPYGYSNCSSQGYTGAGVRILP